MYVSPFDDTDIKKYLNKKFGRLAIWNKHKKKKAKKIVQSSPHLMVRPMLLSYVEDLLEDEKKEYKYSYQVYASMIEKWIEREVERIADKEKQATFSKELLRFSETFALELYQQWNKGNDKLEMPREQLLPLAEKHQIELSDFEITGRSLLTRNTAKEWKFAHKSFLEYFVAKQMKADFKFALQVMENQGMEQAETFYKEMGGKKFKWGMVKVQGGNFQFLDKHEVEVNDFMISKYPVTQALWEGVMGNNPSSIKNCPDCPVEQVTWYDAVVFCNKLSELTGLTPYYTVDKTQTDSNNLNKEGAKKWLVTTNTNANGYRLPTEAEWEYAAKGGIKSKGYTYAGSNNPDEVAWYNKNSKRKTQPVGGLQPNELGIYDMSGNVREWCWDWYSDYNYVGVSNLNPIGSEKGSSRVVRGGSWNLDVNFCRVAYRDRLYPDNGDYVRGFRISRAYPL
ncbi:MAG: SUMF1/EgtB/PvdO family nonheme iron enzyme [Bacteroidota bacterium]